MVTKVRYYRVSEEKTGKTITIKSNIILKKNRYVKIKDNEYARVISESKFKFSIDDIKALSELLKDYDRGTLQNRLYRKLNLIISTDIPQLRLSKEDKELLSYIYYEDDTLENKYIEVLEKALNIKE